MEIRSLGGVASPRPSARAGTIKGAAILANPAFCRNLRRVLMGMPPVELFFAPASYLGLSIFDY